MSVEREMHMPGLSMGCMGYLRVVLLAALVVFPAGFWWSTSGAPMFAYGYAMPNGQEFYLLSKLAALYALTCAWLQVMYGLLKDDAIGRSFLPSWSVTNHRRIGMMTVTAALLHVALFVTAVSLRKETFAYGLLFPNFSDYYHSMVSLGWLALVAMLAVAITGFLRMRKGIGGRIHRLFPAIILFGTIHAQQIGSDATHGIWFYLYLFFGGTALAAWIRKAWF
jgi:hypothetical protein